MNTAVHNGLTCYLESSPLNSRDFGKEGIPKPPIPVRQSLFSRPPSRLSTAAEPNKDSGSRPTPGDLVEPGFGQEKAVILRGEAKLIQPYPTRPRYNSLAKRGMRFQSTHALVYLSSLSTISFRLQSDAILLRRKHLLSNRHRSLVARMAFSSVRMIYSSFSSRE